MVISKRCKICSALDDNNFSITSEYYGIQLPEVIRKVAGLELEARKISTVLICPHCALSLTHASSTIDKVRRALNKMGKNVLSEIASITSTASETFRKFKVEASDSPAPKNVNKVARKGKNKKETLLAENENKAAEEDTMAKDNNGINGVNDAASNIIPVKSLKRKISTVSATNTNDDSMKCQTVCGGKTKNCALCNKVFSQKSELRQHIESDHMGEKLKECPNCSMSFTSLQKYEAHVFKERCLKNLSVCQYPNCSKRFSNVNKMTLHMQTKHSENSLQI